MSTPRRAEAHVKPRRPPAWALLIGGAAVIGSLLAISQCSPNDDVITTAATPSTSSSPTGTEIPNGPVATPAAPSSGLPTPAFPAQFGDGFWLVGKQIAPVLYIPDHPTSKCFWARVDKATFPHPHLVEHGYGKAQKGRKVVIEPTDQVFYTRDCGTWEHHD